MLRLIVFVVLAGVASCGTPPDVPPLTAIGAAPPLVPLDTLPAPAAAPQPPDLSARLARLRARAAALR